MDPNRLRVRSTATRGSLGAKCVRGSEQPDVDREGNTYTVEYEPFTDESQLASRNQLESFMWCKFGDVTPSILGERNLRTPTYGT